MNLHRNPDYKSMKLKIRKPWLKSSILHSSTLVVKSAGNSFWINFLWPQESGTLKFYPIHMGVGLGGGGYCTL